MISLLRLRRCRRLVDRILISLRVSGRLVKCPLSACRVRRMRLRLSLMLFRLSRLIVLILLVFSLIRIDGVFHVGCRAYKCVLW